jgi:hypothetical protein
MSPKAIVVTRDAEEHLSVDTFRVQEEIALLFRISFELKTGHALSCLCPPNPQFSEGTGRNSSYSPYGGGEVSPIYFYKPFWLHTSKVCSAIRF